MHSTMKIMPSNRSHRSLFLVLLMATLTAVVHGQSTNTTNAPTAPRPTPTTPVPTIADAPAASPTVTDVPASEPPASEPPVTTDRPTTAVTTDRPTTVVATDPPTMAVTTDPPTMVATDEPTRAPVATANPTTAPVVVTTAPVPETGAPSEATDAPTAQPTLTPTDEPTLQPTTGTDAPVESPPTMIPTSGTQPTPALVPFRFENLQMTMTGVEPLDADGVDVWAEEFTGWYASFYEDRPQFGISDVSSTVAVVSQDPPLTQRRGLGESRNLQNQALTIVYNQTISYVNKSQDSDFTIQDVITEPFASDDARSQFTEQLRETGDAAFADISGVSGVTQQGADTGGDTVDDNGLSTAAIVGIAVGGAAGLVLLGGAGYWATHRGDGGYEKNIGDHPPSSLQLGGGDDVSTLNEPSKGLRAADSVGGYGDQSVATVDYDYSKAYGGGADSSVVSSVGGTLGSQTQATAAGAGTVDGSFSEDFDVAYQDPNTTVKEIALEVWAPPGKLGVVIDTPNDGAPVVHAIKESSVIADKLQVGDKLICVDDECVEAMTAIKVSKLISRKSGNPTRKLSILRQVVE